MTAPRLTCNSCGKRFVVPDPTRVYRCKACGGKVLPSRTEGAPARQRSEEEALERRRASADIARAHRWVRFVRALYIVQAVRFGFSAIVVGMLLANPALELQRMLIVFVAMVLVTITLVVGAIQCAHQPLLWGIVLGVITTLGHALQYVGENPSPFMWGWVAFVWISIFPLFGVHKTLQEHPDLYVAQRLTGIRRTRRNREVDHDELLRQARGKSWRLSGIFAGAIALLATFGGWRTVSAMRPMEFAPQLEAFESAWEESDYDTLATMVAARELTRLEQRAEVLGWSTLPLIQENEIEQERDEAAVAHALASEGVFGSEWALDGNRWKVQHLVLPAPSIEDSIAAFADAWHASDFEGLASHYPEDNREKSVKALQRMAERRDWSELPEILDGSYETTSENRVSVTLELAEGLLLTRWRLNDNDDWELTSIKPPE